MDNFVNLFKNKIDICVISSTSDYCPVFDTFKMLFIEYFCQNTMKSYSSFNYTHTNTAQYPFHKRTNNNVLKNMIINNTIGFGYEIKKINTIQELSHIKNYHILIAPCKDPYASKDKYKSYCQHKLIKADLFSPLILDEKIVNEFITPLFQPRLNKINDNDKTLGIILYSENSYILQYVHYGSDKLCEFLEISHISDYYYNYEQYVDQDQLILNFVKAFSQSNEIINKMKQIKLSLIVFDICTGMHFYLQSSKPKNYKQIISRDIFLHICKFTIMMSMNKISANYGTKV